MKTRPNRTFVYLALMMVFLLVLGLVVVGMLVSANTPIVSIDDWTRPAALATNSALAATAQSRGQTFTPIPYTDIIDITAAMDDFVRTTPTPPYDPELFEARRKEELGLNTSGGPTQYAIFYMTETALVSAYQTAQGFTATPTPTISMTPSPPATPALATHTLEGAAFTQCAYTWAHRDLPDVTALAQAALDEAAIPKTTVHADAYGEDCIDTNTTTVKGFGAMTTDFYLTVEFTDLTDQSALVDYVETVNTTLLSLPQDTLPARPGHLDITFKSGAEAKYFRTMFDEIKRALDKNLSGANLLNELGGLR
jgi:hypothetical protein